MFYRVHLQIASAIIMFIVFKQAICFDAKLRYSDNTQHSAAFVIDGGLLGIMLFKCERRGSRAKEAPWVLTDQDDLLYIFLL